MRTLGTRYDCQEDVLGLLNTALVLTFPAMIRSTYWILGLGGILYFTLVWVFNVTFYDII